MISPSFTTVIIRDSKVRAVQMFWRVLTVCSFMVVSRCVSFLLTILPSPAPHCTKGQFSPPRTLSDILFGFDTENGCSDLIFCSHILYGVMAANVVTLYVLKQRFPDFRRYTLEIRLKYALIFIMWSLVVAEGLCIVAQERHYSVDVWIALFVVPLGWVSFYQFCPKDPAIPESEKAHPIADQHDSEIDPLIGRKGEDVNKNHD
jgi:hypothetical protein